MGDQPTISARSKKIVAKDPDRGVTPIEDSLIKRSVEAKERFKAKAADATSKECPHKPQITSYASQLERDGDVSERLYAKSFEYRAKKQEMVREQMGSGTSCLLYCSSLIRALLFDWLRLQVE